MVVVTGGLGCAPSVSIIHRILRRRGSYGRLTIIQGVKHADDLIWRAQYEAWADMPDVRVLLAADVATSGWGGYVGLVTALFDRLEVDAGRAMAMLCGPEGMMKASAEGLPLTVLERVVTDLAGAARDCGVRVVALVAPRHAQALLDAWRALPEGEGAAIIGRIEPAPAWVVLETELGERLLPELVEDPLPRIC